MKEKIIETFIASDLEGHYDYEIRKTNITKVRDFFAFIPLWIGPKIRWLKKVKVVERKYYSRRKDFDGGSEWNEEYRIEKIIN